MTGPCSDLFVLDFSRGMPGALATVVLADFGAQVIKVEPPTGDPARAHPSWLAWNRGKKSIVLDLGTPTGRMQAEDLARRADVLVESFRPGESARLGLDYDRLSQINPRLVYCSITGFGQKGRFKDLPDYEGLVAAKTGRMASFAGAIPRTGPMYPAVLVATWAASQAAVRGILGGLLVRDRIGKGQWVQTSLLQGMMCFIGARSSSTFFNRKDPVKFANVERQSEPNLGYIPVRTKDGRWLQHANNAASPRLLKAHLVAIGLGWIYDDERFKGTPTLTKENEDALRELILARMQEKTLDEWMEIYMQHPDVAAEPYLYTAEAFEHTQFVHNHHVVEINDPRVGPMRIVGLLADLANTPGEVGGPAPDLGQHTAEVLAGATTRVAAAVAGGSNGHADSRPPYLLDGVTMLDFSTVIQGPYAASMIADLGARVIKIDATPERADNRRVAGRVNLGDLRTYAGKESVQVDLQTEEGKELIHKLLATTDVVLHNFRPGVPDRLQIDYETCRRINPRVIYIYSGAYGATGPHHMRPGAHPVPGALFGGALRQAGRATPPPASQPMTMAEVRQMSRQMMRANEGAPDPNTSQAVGTAIMLGLLARERTGEGQSIQVTMMCANAWANFGEAFDYPGRPPYAIPDAECYGLHALYRIYPAKDGHVFLACLVENEWAAFCRTVGRTDLQRDPRFSPAARAAHDEELAAALSEIFATHSAAEWEALLLAQNVPCVRVMEPDQEEFWLDDPHAHDNELAVETENESPRVGRYMRTGAIVQLSETPGRYRVAPYPGQHTQLVMREAGFSVEQIEAWRERGIVHWEEPSPVFASSR